jgi:hypothetical protein
LSHSQRKWKDRAACGARLTEEGFWVAVLPFKSTGRWTPHFRIVREFYEINVDGTKNLLDNAAEQHLQESIEKITEMLGRLLH